MLSRRFFAPRSKAIELPTDLDAAMHLLDVFLDARGEQWLVLSTADSVPYLLPGSQAEQLPERLLEQVAVYEMTRDERTREINSQDLYLMAIESYEDSNATPNANDPVHVEGIVSGPWLSPQQTATAIYGKLIVTRADMLFGLVDAVADGFVYPVKPVYGDCSRISHHLMLPGGTLEETESARNILLAFPVSSTSMILQEPGNDGAVCDIWHDLLRNIQQDMQDGPLSEQTIPVPSLHAYRSDLERRGLRLSAEGYLTVTAGSWLTRLWQTVFPRRLSLPPEGDPLAYACLGQLVVDDLPDWPGPRSQALHQCVRRGRVFWTPQLASGLRIFYGGEEDSQYQVQRGVLKIPERAEGSRKHKLYFDVDDTFADEIRGGVDIEVECSRLRQHDVSVSYYTGYGRRRGRLQQKSLRPRGSSAGMESLSVELRSPGFHNDLKGGTDFCLNLPRGFSSIREVVVRAHSRIRQMPPEPVQVVRSKPAPLLFVNDASVLAQVDAQSGELRMVGNRRWTLDCRLAARDNLLFTIDQDHLTCVDAVTGLVRLVGKPSWQSRALLGFLDDKVYVVDQERLYCCHPVTGQRKRIADAPKAQALCTSQSFVALVTDCKLQLVDLDGGVEVLGSDSWTETADICSLGAWLIAVERGQLFAVALKDGQRQPLGTDAWSNHTRLAALDGWLFAVDGAELWRVDPADGSRHSICSAFDHVGELCAVRQASCLLPPGGKMAVLGTEDLEEKYHKQLALTLEQDSGESWASLGQVLQLDGQHRAAQRAYQLAILRQPDLVEAYAAIAAILLEWGDHQGAKQWWQWQATVDGADDNVCVELGSLAYDHLRQVEVSRTWYEEAIRRQPKNGLGYVGIGRLFECAHQDDRQAQNWYRKAIDADTGSPHACTSLAELHFRKGNFGDAIRAYRLAQQRDPSSVWPLQQMVTIYRDYLQDYEKALQELHRLCELQPRRAQPYEAIASIYASCLKQPELALEFYLKAWQRCPSTQLARAIGEIYRDFLDQPEEAAQWSERACD